MDARILLVEDDPSIREVTAIGLRAAGFEVDTAADGAAGLERWRQAQPDLVLLDVMLPRLDGLEAGADDYVTKPFEMAELVARIRAALRRRRSTAEGGTGAALELGPLAIDTAGRTVRRGDEDIALTRTEFDLLVELAQRPGQVLTRDQLLDRVWGYDYLGDSRLVDVAIGRVRAKVERDPANPELLVTVRGSGYKAVR